jgi:hypothetical protein
MRAASHLSSLLQDQALLAFILLVIVQGIYGLQNPLDNFCRRYGHQTTVIDDKLYIDGGWVDYDTFPEDPIDYSSK